MATPHNAQSALEGIPHLCHRVCMIWGSLELDGYINSLVMDSRDGARKGLPMEVGAELMWLAKVNKWRRALDYQERLKISLHDARAKVMMEDDGKHAADVWGHSLAGGDSPARRYTDQAASLRPHRRRDENSLFGIIYRLVTSKFVLLAAIAILTLKAFWPALKVLF
jgi:hypothetical protein